jgi:S-adenosylmethionine hydrolase
MLITLLTDFGTTDYFVGAMKGAILCVNPEARIFDLTHEVPAHDIRAGAFLLLASYKTFPPGTIHVAVVDPGVGSLRRPILVIAGEQFFVGPDNGLFSYVYEREASARVIHLTNEEYFRHPVSATFHGRDIFAPIAGALSTGTSPARLGEEITDYVRLEPGLPLALADGALEGVIIHVDRFGNCVTNFACTDVSGEMFERGARLLVGEQEINAFRRFYAGEGNQPGQLFAICGSAGLLEISVFQDSAARRLKAQRGQSVRLLKNSEAVE